MLIIAQSLQVLFVQNHFIFGNKWREVVQIFLQHKKVQTSDEQNNKFQTKTNSHFKLET